MGAGYSRGQGDEVRGDGWTRQRPSLCADRTASEARRPEAGSRAGGVSRAERGNDGSPSGARRRRRLDAKHDSATGHVSWPGTPMQSWRCSVDLLRWTSSLCGIGIAAPAQPGRRCCRGAKRSAAGMCRRHFPWSASASAQRRRREVIGTRAQQKKRCAAPKGSAPDGTRRDQFAVIVCNCSITPGSTKTHG